MASYESDSSGDSIEHTITDVMLGYASTGPIDDDFSRLGGSPTWPDATNPPSASLAKCKVCHNVMALLLQINGDLPERFLGHERRVYVFGCRNTACRRKPGCIRGLRGTRVSKANPGITKDGAPDAQQSQELGVNIGHQIFGTSANPPNGPTNPFASSQAPKTTNPFSLPSAAPANSLASQLTTHNKASHTASDLPATFASKINISSQPAERPTRETWPTTAPQKPYPQYYLDGLYEVLEPLPASVKASGSASASSSKMDIGTEAATTDTDRDLFESSMDKTFQQFADRLGYNSEQVLRYEYGGTPLLYSRDDAVGTLLSGSSAKVAPNAKVKTQARDHGSRMPNCPNCAKKRVFELQLVPHAITELEVDEAGLDGMDWGTVILGVCEGDCEEKGVERGEWSWIEEWVGVQWEEEMKPVKP